MRLPIGIGRAWLREPTFRRRGLMVGAAPSDTESDGKASGPEREDRCGAEGDARPRRRPMPSQGGLPPSGRNHLHRVKPVARTEAMIDRQEASNPEQERGRPPDTSA